MAEEKLLRLQILRTKLETAQLHLEEARLEKIQRELACQDQKDEGKFNAERREAVEKEMERDAELLKERQRPSYALCTEVAWDEDEKQYSCSHDGVVAYGETPAMAHDNFDHVWVFGKK
jgi:hypothetical protein